MAHGSVGRVPKHIRGTTVEVMGSDGEAAPEEVEVMDEGLGSKQQVHARSLARGGSPEARGPSTPQPLRGSSPPHDAPDSPELQAIIDRPPFSLADFRKPIPTAAERLRRDVERIASNDPTLVRVHWERTGATDEDLAQLAAALSSNTHVRTLHLEGNPGIRDVDEAGLTALEMMLSGGRTPITAVHLAGSSVSNERVAALGQLCVVNALRCVKANDPTLRELVFCGTGVDDDVASALAEALPGNTVLETIRFGSAGSDRRMTDCGAGYLETALPQCGVVTLTLGFTSVTADKIQVLRSLCVANACRRLRDNDEQLVRLSWRNLTCLSADKGLTDTDVSNIAAALEGNTVLRSIDLWGNAAVSDNSATMSSTNSKGLARCLQSCAVEWVRLDWTAVSAAGKEAVRKACMENVVRNPEHEALFGGLLDGDG